MSSTFTLYNQPKENDDDKDLYRIKEKDLEASFRFYPQPQDHISPLPIPKLRRYVFSFGRSYTLGEKHKYLESVALTGPRDPRIGKDAQIIRSELKGYRGRIADIGRNSVTIQLPGRIPPEAVIKLSDAVCMWVLFTNLYLILIIKPGINWTETWQVTSCKNR